MKTSNKFTLSRIILAPVIFLIYYIPVWVGAAAGSPLSVASVCVAIPLLAFAEFTDYLDGHFARKHNEVSDFGKMFDPFADVFLHLSMVTCRLCFMFLYFTVNSARISCVWLRPNREQPLLPERAENSKL